VKNLAILGSTGSIGRNALHVVDSNPTRLRVVALAAGDNATLLGEQAQRYQPAIVAMATEDAVDRLRQTWSVGVPPRIEVGGHGLIAVATHPAVDLVICASSGTAALEAVVAAIDAGKTIALANKEVLVMAGALVMDAARRRGVAILPIDSEHNAIHQCLHGRVASEIRRVILTASGGPFRDFSLDALERVTPEAALRHPTWQMGRKITIDSATMMNKGLEIIEARWLFGVDPENIHVVIHPQSVVHSMVELTDGSVIAQLGVTDMRLPIQYACSYPDRWESTLPSLDLVRFGSLEFRPPDPERFPCLRLAYQAARSDGTLAIALNAANEVAVDAFLGGRLSFTAIPRVIEQTMDAHEEQPVATVEIVRCADAWAREYAREICRGLELRV
jgi:1-deoxy-D-xylulose-5-phosphate reductoisomerase